MKFDNIQSYYILKHDVFICCDLRWTYIALKYDAILSCIAAYRDTDNSVSCTVPCGVHSGVPVHRCIVQAVLITFIQTFVCLWTKS